MDIAELNEKIKNESAFIDLLLGEIRKVIVGQKEMIERLIVGLLGNGHTVRSTIGISLRARARARARAR